MGLEDQEYYRRRAEALRRQQGLQQPQQQPPAATPPVSSNQDLNQEASASGPVEQTGLGDVAVNAVANTVSNGVSGGAGSVGNGAATGATSTAQTAAVPAANSGTVNPKIVGAGAEPIRSRVTKTEGGSVRRHPVRKRQKASSGAQIRDFPKSLLNAVASGVFGGKAMDLTQRDVVAAFVYAHFGDATPDLLDGMESQEAKERVLELSSDVRKKDSDLSLLETVRLMKKKLDSQSRQLDVLQMLLCYLVLDRTGSVPAGLNAGKPAKKVDVRIDEVLDFSFEADEQGRMFHADRSNHYGRVKR